MIRRTRTRDGCWHLHIRIARWHLVFHWLIDTEFWREMSDDHWLADWEAWRECQENVSLMSGNSDPDVV
jgi:hypothetical protein